MPLKLNSKHLQVLTIYNADKSQSLSDAYKQVYNCSMPAATRAIFKLKMIPAFVQAIGMNNDAVVKIVEEKMIETTANQLVKYRELLWDHVHVDPKDLFIELEGGAYQAKPWDELTERQRIVQFALIKSNSSRQIKNRRGQTITTRQITLHDRSKVIELLGRALGAFDGERSTDAPMVFNGMVVNFTVEKDKPIPLAQVVDIEGVPPGS